MHKPFASVALAGLIVAAMSTEHASATHFSVLANVAGSPQIGAVKGTTIFGTARYDGDGSLFSINKSGTYALLHTFIAGNDGQEPNASLAMDDKGDIFGTAYAGGAFSLGTLWEFSKAGAMSVPHAFGADGDGANPNQGPTLAADGTVFGTAKDGAIDDDGSVFSLTHSGAYSTIYEFLSGADGHCPFSGVAVSPAGTIYGTTVGWGYGGEPNGTVWQYTPSGGLQTIYVFQNGNDGEWPDQAPVVDAAGNIYGTTHIQNGGEYAGAIWMITAGGSFSVLRDLNGKKDGYGPNSPLLLDIDGNLYGTTASGGKFDLGTVFRISPSGAFHVLHSFTGGSDGGVPTGNLVHNEKGAIFGGTGYGSVFKIVP